MYRSLLSIALIASTLMVSAPAPLSAQGMGEQQFAAANDIPLVVIRFNQRKVFYERPLYNAVSKAVAIKPSAIFEVVSFVPQSSSEDTQEKLDQMAASQQSAVVGTLRSIGIPQNQIRTSRDVAPDTQFHEVYIYVE